MACFQGIVKSTSAEGENLGLYLLGEGMPSSARFLNLITGSLLDWIILHCEGRSCASLAFNHLMPAVTIKMSPNTDECFLGEVKITSS